MTDANQQYRIQQWGDGYFAADGSGRLVVKPAYDLAAGPGDENGPGISLTEVVGQARDAGLGLPLLVRFNDILRHRVGSLVAAFDDAIAEEKYPASYHPIFPIKVNQQRSVVETIASCAAAGLECGSKAELLAVLASSQRDGVIVCNGYKDRDYVHLCLMATTLGYRCYLVLEKLSELNLVISESVRMGVSPVLGLRARLSRVSRGHWQNSGGEKSKFGFSAAQLIEALEKLRGAGLAESVELLHVHLGSQISVLDDITRGVEEAVGFYTELRNRQFPVNVLDLGGGLGVNYDGMGDSGIFSINYGLRDYARALVRTVAAGCASARQPCPELFTESGRALTAHHAVLVTNVVDREFVQTRELRALDDKPESAVESLYRLAEKDVPEADYSTYYQQARSEMRRVVDDFSAGKIDLAQRSLAENCELIICTRVRELLEKTPEKQPETLAKLRERLAARYFLNFSIFQSLPDIWALNQVFPVIPLQRLDEEPGLRAILCDLTCDSDGQVSNYVGRNGIGETLAVHELEDDEEYLMGIFLVGAYQEILGDMHNLFGDTNSVDIELDGSGGFRLAHAEPADTAGEILRYVHFDPEGLLAVLQDKLAASNLLDTDKRSYLKQFKKVLDASTYLTDH